LGERDALDILWLADLVRLLSRDVAPVDLVELALWKRPELVDAHLMRADACLPSFRDETKVWEGMVRDLMAGRFRGIEGVDFPRARHHAQVAVALAPGHEATWLELGFLEFMAARFDEADQVFQRVIALGDVSGLARLMNCFRLLSLHETERAIAAAESILEDHDEGNLAVEPALEILSKIAPAERCLPLCDAFLERFPGHVVATFNRGRLRLVLGQVEDAGQDFREAMDRAEGTDALHRHGRALRGLRQFDMAVRAFDLALAGEPGHRPTLQELGQLVASEASVDLGEDRLRDLMQRSADADLLLTAARFGARLILSSEVVEDRLDAAWVAMVASERRSVDTRDAPEDTARELRARALAVMESLVRTQGARLRDARSWPNSLTRLDAASDLDETERAAWLRFWRSLD
ncbi:MAG: hypothetical protein KDB53_18310, partial [Planctomycetes bacterium]|nr:hypothetical protein [Planctomycetota bacterium]